MRTSPNLKIMSLSASAILALSIMAAAAQQSARQSSGAAGYLAMQKGRALSPEEVSGLENKVAQHPDDFNSQTLLLGYYSSTAAEGNLKKFEDTILWLIQNHPEAAVLGSHYGRIPPGFQNYVEAQRLWKQQLQKDPSDLQIIFNAGMFFSSWEQNLDLAINAFKKGKSLDPKSAYWDDALGDAYKRLFWRTKDPSVAEEELSSFESLYAKETVPLGRNYLLPDLATSALATGRIDKAIEYANIMLSSAETSSKADMIKGDMIYNGNNILGMVAIKRGDLEGAARYLLLSGDTPGSPTLMDHGPDMSLAKELLDRGQRDTVIAFLKKCCSWWRGEESNCAQWIQLIEQGRTPDFQFQKPLYYRDPFI